ncbi:hypothetical protein JCM11641_002186 [Rhodosporidiobolus odoratus]
MTCYIDTLPPELLDYLFTYLAFPSLLSLRQCSSHLNNLISTSYLPNYARTELNYSPLTLSHLPFHDPTHTPWSILSLWSSNVQSRFQARQFRAEVLGGPNRTWKKCLPVIKLWEHTQGVRGVLIARGREMEVWEADTQGDMQGADVVVQGYGRTTERLRGGWAAKEGDATQEVTAFCEGDGAGEVVLGRVDGTVQRLRVKRDTRLGGGRGGAIELGEVARYSVVGQAGGKGRKGKTTVQALHSSGGTMACASTTRSQPATSLIGALATTSNGSSPGSSSSSAASTPTASLANLSLAASLTSLSARKSHAISLHSLTSPWTAPDLLLWETKPWSVLLSPSHSGASGPSWLAVGHTGTSPLFVIPLTPSGPLTSGRSDLLHTTKSTSVYALTTPSLQCSPFAHPSQTLIGAFYDSTTRVFDLRIPPPRPSSSSSSDWDASPTSHPSSNEVMRLTDPRSDDPSYSLSHSGPTGTLLTVGSARNASLRLFDLRNPSRSITAFAPGRDKSPIYGLAGGEGQRVWGVTERRGFGVDWDPVRRGKGEKVAWVEHAKRRNSGGGGGGKLRWTE